MNRLTNLHRNFSIDAGAWIPALVFGIPGDSITAIAIGVLYMKNMNPGPTLFTENPQNIAAIFLVFIIANLLLLPLGWLTVKAATKLLGVSRAILMPIILLFSITGSFSSNNALFSVVLMAVAGIFAFGMEENGFPLAPLILGLVLGPMLEVNFVTSMIKSDDDPTVFFTRAIAMWLAAATCLILLWPLLRKAVGLLKSHRN